MPLDVIIPFYFKHLSFGLSFALRRQTGLREWPGFSTCARPPTAFNIPVLSVYATTRCQTSVLSRRPSLC